ncbi:MAG: DUF2723 domain-containing protein [Vicinamibacteraceae bacterium]
MASEPAPAVHDRAIDRSDVAVACACGGIALAAYLRTLAPGLTSDLDSPMFQFIGRALGVAHNPGYPLYTLLTWPIAQMPIGELAWRINVFSAVMGAVATGLVYLGARRLEARPIVGAAAALGFAAGATFWSQAVIAEVYTLHAALVGGLLVAAFTWSRSRQPVHFYAALGCLAAGLGHHTTILAFAPGLALQALLVDRRFVFRLRTWATSAAILALGLLPYALILVRSRDPEAYVESRATTLGELAQVVLGRQFQDRIVSAGWREQVAAQAPLLWDRVFVADVTVIGLAFAAIGALSLLRRRPGDALLMISGGAVVTAFAAGYAVPDVPVFVIPAILCLWLFAAAGGEQACRLAARLLPAPAVDGVQALFCLAALSLPIWLTWQHAGRVDRSGDRQDALQVQRLFDVLPPRSAIVSGDFIADRMLQYERRGHDRPGARAIAIGPRDPAALRALLVAEAHVVAFAPAVDRLRFEGLDFSATPVALLDGPVADLIARLPRGAVVALAVPAEHAARFAPTVEPARRRLGTGVPAGGGDFALVGVVGDSTPARLVDHTGGARLALPAGDGVWGHGRSELDIVAEAGSAAIRLGGRDLLRTATGVALAVWAPDGMLLRVAALQAEDGYLVPVPAGPFSAYPLIGAADGQLLAPNAWVDVTPSVGSGSIVVRIPVGARLELYASDDARLSPRVLEHVGRGPVDLSAFEAPPGVEPDADGPPRPAAVSVALPDRVSYTARVVAAATEGTPVSVFLTFGGLPRRAAARLVSAGSEGGSVRSVDTAGLLRGPDRRSAVIRMTRDDQERLIGAGWSAVETDDAGSYRWMADREARLLLPPSTPWRTVTVDAFRPDGTGAAGLGIRINGETLPAQPLRGGWQRYAWTLPPTASVALGRASAELSLIVDGPASPRGLAVSAICFDDAP